jgi:hypothetical protein
MGIEAERVRLEWIAASEGDRVQKVTNEMVAELKRLGPLQIRTQPRVGARDPGGARMDEPECVPLVTVSQLGGAKP